MANNELAQKRRWYQNLSDVYKITKRTYSWFGWLELALVVVPVVIAVALSLVFKNSIGYVVLHGFWGLITGTLLAMIALARLSSKALYAQLEGVKGNVSAVIRSIKRGWIVYEEPVAFNKKQDLVWRVVGRPGIVLISEGPSSRVKELLEEETRKCNRVAPQVPVHQIQSGTGAGQVSIGKVLKTINKLPKSISKEEVPMVGKRLQSLQAAKGNMMPKGVDPSKVKVNRRMMRGK